MSSDQIFKVIYTIIAILATYVAATRLMAGEWTWAVFPLAILAFCIYRLFTFDDG